MVHSVYTSNSRHGESDGEEGGRERVVFRNVGTIPPRPVLFFLYSLDDNKGRALTSSSAAGLRRKIIANGGVIVDEEEDADTIIVKDEEAAERYREKYDNYRNTIYVEPASFVSRCISEQKYRHLPQPVKGISGYRGVVIRIPFTAADDAHLVDYLALKIPDDEAGGRTGNNIFKQLTELGEEHPDKYGWAQRHPWSSWRERYKKRPEYFSQLIEEHLKTHPIPADGKGLYPYDRRRGRGGRGLVVHSRAEEEEEDVDFEDFERPAQERHDSQLRRRRRQEAEEEEDEVEVEQETLGIRAKKARYTDLGPRRASDVEHGRNVGVQRPYSDGGRVQHPSSSLQPTSPIDEDFEQSGFEPGDFEQEQINYEVTQDVPLKAARRPGPAEAGPSNTQRSPSHTHPRLESQPSRRAGSSPSSSHHRQQQHQNVAHPPTSVQRRSKPRQNIQPYSGLPMSSQATLVGPVPSQLQQPSTSRPSRSKPVAIEHSDLGGASHAPKSGTVQRNESRFDRSIQQEDQESAVIKQVQKPKKRRRINVITPPVGLLPEGPPYRNTRSRSQSVEPIIRSIAANRKAKGKRKAAEMEAVPETVIEESDNDDDMRVEEQLKAVSEPGASEEPQSHDGTQEVADMLGVVEDSELQRDAPLRKEPEQQNEYGSDDERTSVQLFGGRRLRAHAVPSTEVQSLEDDDDLHSIRNPAAVRRARPVRNRDHTAVEIGSSRLSSNGRAISTRSRDAQSQAQDRAPSHAPRSSLPSIPATSAPKTHPAKPRSSSIALAAYTHLLSPQSKTPIQRTISGSSAASSSIPISHTRASEEKKRRAQTHKEVFSPVPGTRAATYLSLSQTRAL